MKSAKTTTKTMRRPGTTLAAFLIVLPLAAAVLGLLLYGPEYGLIPADSEVLRYFKHEIEWVEVVLFCCALGTLLGKLWQNRRDRAACRLAVVPAWDGKPVPSEVAIPIFSRPHTLPLT